MQDGLATGEQSRRRGVAASSSDTQASTAYLPAQVGLHRGTAQDAV